MKRVFIAFLGATILTSCAMKPSNPSGMAKGSTPWQAWIEQDGQKYELPGSVILRKAPFEIHFVGNDPQHGYGYAATINRNELPSLDHAALLFREGNGLFVDSPNTKIAVADVGVVQKQHSSWNMWTYHAPNESGGDISGFQRRSALKDGRVEYVRKIDTLCMDNGSKDICSPIDRSGINSIFGMMIGVSFSPTTFFDPAFVTIEFTR
jgi:hypothetical protein